MTAQTESPHPPIAAQVGWVGWIRGNLFNTWYNSLLTLVLGGLVTYGAFAVSTALFRIDYTILRVNLTLLMIGRFPANQLWRPWVAGAFLALAAGISAGLLRSAARDRATEAGLSYSPPRLKDLLRRVAPLIGVVVVILALTETLTPTYLTVVVVVVGVGGSLIGRRIPADARRWAWLGVVLLIFGAYLAMAAFGGVGWAGWGGLHLNVFLTIAGIAFAFPLGLLLALGRRSSLPAFRALSITYIELVRGVPLITILLFGAFAIGFLLPEGVRPSLITRMLIAITLFEAAYIAEVVRGGLQAVPKGQVEASQSLGMPMWKTLRLIVLPQALRATIPPMVGQFIALYKDTTLVAILGVLELLNVSFTVNTQREFLGQGLFVVTMAFAALIFWVGSYTMSREARRLEKKLGVGER